MRVHPGQALRMIDFDLTDEQRLLQETARDFAYREASAPRNRDRNASSTAASSTSRPPPPLSACGSLSVLAASHAR
ncbi:MAG: hypothetical protein M3088_02265 [Actinomycetota bacterium]|nr:hypothetical protein [Actinomycetota bacterium]